LLVVEQVREVEAVTLATLFGALASHCSADKLQNSAARGLACGLFCPQHPWSPQMKLIALVDIALDKARALTSLPRLPSAFICCRSSTRARMRS
jgi:hypothetical protein